MNLRLPPFLKNILIVFCTLLSINSYSQDSLSIEGNVGILNTQLVSSDDFGLLQGVKYKRTFGSQFSSTINVPLWKGFGIASGIAISHYGQNYVIEPSKTYLYCFAPGDKLDFNVDLIYLKVPVNLYYMTSSERDLRFRFSIGAGFDRLIFAKDNHDRVETCQVNIPPAKERYSRYDLEVNSSLALLYKIDDKTTYTIGLNAGKGFLQTTDENSHLFGLLIYLQNSYNQYYGISAGIIHKL